MIRRTLIAILLPCLWLAPLLLWAAEITQETVLTVEGMT